MSDYKTDQQIIDEAPVMAETYCNYDYGSKMSGSFMSVEKRIDNLRAENRILHKTIRDISDLCHERDITIQKNNAGYVLFGQNMEVFGESLEIAVDNAIDQNYEYGCV